MSHQSKDKKIYKDEYEKHSRGYTSHQPQTHLKTQTTDKYNQYVPQQNSQYNSQYDQHNKQYNQQHSQQYNQQQYNQQQYDHQQYNQQYNQQQLHQLHQLHQQPQIKPPSLNSSQTSQKKHDDIRVSIPKTSTPKLNTPKLNTPKPNTPKLNTPKVNTPKLNTPKVNTPKLNTPKVNTPKVSTPKPYVSLEEMTEAELDEYRIANFKPRDQYTKKFETKQDRISENEEELKKRFIGFTLIDYDDYRAMQPGTYIRYLKDGSLYRAGGVLKLNKWPKYWILESLSVNKKKITWSVPLQNTKTLYFQKDKELAKRIQKKKNKMYEAVEKQEYMLIKNSEFAEMKRKMEAAGINVDKILNRSHTSHSHTDTEASEVYSSSEDDYDDDSSSVQVDIKLQKRRN